MRILQLPSAQMVALILGKPDAIVTRTEKVETLVTVDDRGRAVAKYDGSESNLWIINKTFLNPSSRASFDLVHIFFQQIYFTTKELNQVYRWEQ